MSTIGEIYRYIDGFAPFSTAMEFDNAGLLAGDAGAPARTALLSLDITPDVVREAAREKAELVVSHHPVIFQPLKALRPGTAPYLLARYGIAAVCAHTNLDMARGGVNDCLAARLGLRNTIPAALDGPSGLRAALAGETDREYEPREFAAFVKKALGCDGLFFASGGRKITRAGVCGGGGSEYFYDAASHGCQAFVTGEAKHHELIDAKNMGVTLVVAGHFYTENVVMEPLRERLQKAFPDVAFRAAKAFSCPAEYL